MPRIDIQVFIQNQGRFSHKGNGLQTCVVRRRVLRHRRWLPAERVAACPDWLALDNRGESGGGRDYIVNPCQLQPQRADVKSPSNPVLRDFRRSSLLVQRHNGGGRQFTAVCHPWRVRLLNRGSQIRLFA